MLYRFFLLFLCVFCGGLLQAKEETWLSIDTEALTLVVKRGNSVVATFKNIAIGRGGVVSQGMRKNGDDRTPLGTFRIAWINRGSGFYRFFGLNYPTKAHALRAYVEGLIDEPTYNTILTAIRTHRLPPQNTPMGGYVGIHGLGQGDRRIHRLYNWTHGCVALTNTQIDRLSRWIRIGTKVVIH